MTKEKSYVDHLVGVVKGFKATTAHGHDLPDAIERICAIFKGSEVTGNKIILIGNGGSAAIASHVAIDLSKNAHTRAITFNDAATLTCLSNDYGYEEVFAKQVEYYARPGDTLVAISSSGVSANIINAVAVANHGGRIATITFSGFDPDNQLRRTGHINFYVSSMRYGYVELAHMILLHSVIDKLALEHEMVEAAE
jgi:D-sedoheptulose 7-phosphate isomerase